MILYELYVFGVVCRFRKQEEMVYNVRKRLEEALMADMLALAEEASSGEEALKDEGNCHEDKEDV